VERTNQAMEILSQEDIKQLMESERVRQFAKVIIDETTRNLKEDLKEEIKSEMEIQLEDTNKRLDELKKAEEERAKQFEKMREAQEKRDAMLLNTLKETMENKK